MILLIRLKNLDSRVLYQTAASWHNKSNNSNCSSDELCVNSDP